MAMTKQRWNTPERMLVKCIAIAKFDTGLRGDRLVSAVQEVVPHWKDYFEPEITDNALVQRACRAREENYQSEAPENNELLGLYWPIAKKVAEEGGVLSKKDLADLVGVPGIVAHVEQPLPEERKEPKKFFYILGSDRDSTCCGIGIADDVPKRTSAFIKGSVDNSMRVSAVYRCEDAGRVETQLKSALKELHMGNERFHVSPREMESYFMLMARRLDVMTVRTVLGG